MPLPKIGDYVTACLVQATITDDYPEGLNEPRQGVFVQDNEDGTIAVQGEGEGDVYICFGPENVTIVVDSNLFSSTRMFVYNQRKKLGLRNE